MMEIDLQQVFTILDENGEGQIQLQRFVDVANNYYSDAGQLARITKALDPDNTGFINYDQFCEGISQISSLQGLTLNEVASDLTRRSRENSLVEDSDRRSLKTTNDFDLSSLPSWRNLIQEENQDGSTTTFNEYDVESDDAFHHPSNKSQTVQFRGKKTPNTKSQQNSDPKNPFLPSNLESTSFGDEEEFTGVAEPETSTYSPDTAYSRPVSVRASQIFKRNSYLQPVVSSEQADQQLQETVDELQKTVDTLSEQKRNTTERLSKIQSENTDLKSRLLALEDRFQDLEGHNARTARNEQQKYTEYINQKDRTFLQEKEILQSRINAIESELKQTQTGNVVMKKDVKELKQKLDDVDGQLHESQIRCNHLSADNEELIRQLRQQREDLENEKLTNAQLLEQLTLESSRQKFGRTYSRTESILKSSETRIQDLDAEVRALKMDNEKLTRENQELRERADPMGTVAFNSDSQSFAAELESCSKDELMRKLRDQYSINDRLREYIERMLTVIIEHNPQLLEVTTSAGLSIGSMNSRRQVFTTTQAEPVSVPSDLLTSTPSLTSSTVKEPADNS